MVWYTDLQFQRDPYIFTHAIVCIHKNAWFWPFSGHNPKINPVWPLLYKTLEYVFIETHTLILELYSKGTSIIDSKGFHSFFFTDSSGCSSDNIDYLELRDHSKQPEYT